jgi:membrane-associated phospholipid phosphatase
VHFDKQNKEFEWRRTMDHTPDFPSNQSLDNPAQAVVVEQRTAHSRRTIMILLWVIGLIALLVASAIVRFHPAPWSLDLQTTNALQQLPRGSWLGTAIGWPTTLNDPIPSVSSITLWFIVLSLIGVIARFRGRWATPWFVTGIFIWLGTMVMWTLFFLIDFVVARPRPSSSLIHVYIPEPIPTFPSGHVVFAVVYYGFLLYLSLSKPVSEWRYRWILIPLQLYAALNILFIGYSRVYEGSHWLTDVFGGYLMGALFLGLLIVLYRWTLDKLTERHEKRVLQKAQQNQPA